MRKITIHTLAKSLHTPVDKKVNRIHLNEELFQRKGVGIVYETECKWLY
jgi:hypothetical protein